MQSEPIPDEVMREAEKAWSYSFTKGVDLVAVIARALLARDKRAAEIVAGLPWHVDISPDHIRSRRSDEYATAILTYKEAEQP